MEHTLNRKSTTAIPGIKISRAEINSNSTEYGQLKKFSTAELWNIQRRKRIVVIR
ncbi:MAG: hypothetical protein JST81_09560 [Bacteroidetes bacterium]|nr:hypothetical protein [Bacteroidota bacterium]